MLKGLCGCFCRFTENQLGRALHTRTLCSCPQGIDVAAVTKFLNLTKAQNSVPETVREHYVAAASCRGGVKCGVRETPSIYYSYPKYAGSRKAWYVIT
ncbi:MAG: hypothetical protein ACLR2G_00320 [Phascolarctobacterium faecium]